MNNSSKLFINRICTTHKYLITIFIVQCIAFISIHSQYFNGPNKAGYKIFEYKVYNTPHFEIYHYFNNDSLINALAESAEKWYQRHQMLFKDTFKTRNPIIFYANHADFQQTNAVMGNISVGTGGVTESLKNRVVLPMMESAAQTDHVLGHELVHAFQYKLMLRDDSSQMRSIRNIPLWMVEGMAEYCSIGSFDPNTAMWMRDAIINNDFPSLNDLTRSYKYFPYRYGHAFWAYFTALYGDTAIIKLFDLTTKFGYEKAIDSIAHINEKVFSNLWKSSTKEYYFKLLKDTIEKPIGKKIIYEKNSGTINIAPSLSPDGKYIAYISEKDLFTFDLFLANAHTGKIIKKLSSTIRDNRIDDFNFLESGGTWSPDSKKFAFVIFSQGKNKLLVIDVDKPKKYYEIEIPNVESFSNPSWSPDGKSIVVAGLVEGVSDLYLYDLESKKAKNLTNDVSCNLLPSWSTDSKYIVFSTDRPNTAIKDSTKRGYNIGLLNLQTKETTLLPLFPEADNLNPQFSPDNKWIYFLSDADGYRNLYKYSIDSSKVYRLTQLITGISGVTEFTPAFTIDRQKGDIIYTHYYKSEYNLYSAPDTSFKGQLLPNDSTNFIAAHLPPFKRIYKNIVNNNIAGITEEKSIPVDSFKVVPYKPKFKLDYIGGTSVGVGMSSYYGTGMAGSVDMLFSDIVGNYQLFSSVAINGQIYDFSGAAAFGNYRNRINWGVALSHTPLRYNSFSGGNDTLYNNMLWIFEDNISLFAIRPLSQTRRIEAYTLFSRYSYHLEREVYIYNGIAYNLAQIEKKMPTSPGFSIAAVGAAYTLDNAYMGIASPLRGQRFRIESEYYFGKLNFYNLLLDYRKYFFINPFCIALRLYHTGRYGSESTNNVINALYIGWPWLVRGYGENYISGLYEKYSDSTSLNQKINQLFGSRIALANFEFRIPFTGPARLCLIPFKYFVSELSLFADGGLAWGLNYKPTLKLNPDLSKQHGPLLSCGLSLRINLFGYMVLEPFYAVPIQKDAKDYAGFALNFLPGW